MAIYNREYRKRNAEKLKSQLLEKAYGITRADYHRILSEQGGGCAMCGTKYPGRKGAFHVDHDHETNRVRGLLCVGCNGGLGLLGDDPAKASEMLYRYAVKNYPQRMAG